MGPQGTAKNGKPEFRTQHSYDDYASASVVDFAHSNHNSRPRQLVRKTLSTKAGDGSAVIDEEATYVPELPPRLVQRDRAFFQSSNKLRVQHNQGNTIFKLLKHNWFHAFLRWPTRHSFAVLMACWTGAIFLFAFFYMMNDQSDHRKECHLGPDEDTPITFAGAFAFSLETCTTVGYGLPNGVNTFFEKCHGLQVIIFFQMTWSMIFNAFLITFLYTRLGRSETRGTQVIFSRNALVSVVDGQVRFQFRLFDCDAKRPVVEAHVRMYVVMKDRPVPRPLRTLQPDDELGGMLFLSFPTTVSHHIDLYSLLHPPSKHMSFRPSGLVLRQVDGWTASRDDVVCPICGECYGTMERLKSHVRYQKIVESKEDYPKENTHLSLSMELFDTLQQPTTDLENLKQYFHDHVSEVIAVVEGIDPIMSGTFQSLHSYRFEDIVWKPRTQFAPCMEIVSSTDGNYFQVDLDRYHDMYAPPEPPKGHRRKQSSLRQGDKFFSTNTLTVRKARKQKRNSPPPGATSKSDHNSTAASATTSNDDDNSAAAVTSAPTTNQLTSLFRNSPPPSVTGDDNGQNNTAAAPAPAPNQLASLFEEPPNVDKSSDTDPTTKHLAALFQAPPKADKSS